MKEFEAPLSALARQVLRSSMGMLSRPGMNSPRRSSVEEMSFWMPGARSPSAYTFHE